MYLFHADEPEAKLNQFSGNKFSFQVLSENWQNAIDFNEMATIELFFPSTVMTDSREFYFFLGKKYSTLFI